MPSHTNNHRRKRSQSQSANSQPILVNSGEDFDHCQSLEEITQQFTNYVEQPDFQERMMMSHFAVARAPSVPRYAPVPNAQYSSSIAASYTPSLSSSRNASSQYSVRYPHSQHSQYIPSVQRSRAPSLTSDTTAASSSVVSWDRQAEYIARSGIIDDDGVVRSGNMPCDFSFLGCTRTSQLGLPWHEHSRFHLGTASPPTQVSCPAVGCDWRRSYSNGEEAWKSRSDHVKNEHASPSYWSRGWRRPDQILIQHLWYNRIILPEQYRDLKVSGQTGSSSYTIIHGHRDSRDRERRHSARRPQG